MRPSAFIPRGGIVDAGNGSGGGGGGGGGGDAPVFQAAGALIGISGAATGNPAWPAHEVGDVGILVITTNTTAGRGLSVTEGFTKLGQMVSSISASQTVEVWYCTATSNAMAAPTVAAAAALARARIFTVRGAGSEIPFNLFWTYSTSISAGGIAVSVPHNVALVDNTLVINYSSARQSSGTGTPIVVGWANASLTGFAAQASTYVAFSGGDSIASGVMETAGPIDGSSANWQAGPSIGVLNFSLQFAPSAFQ